MGLARLPRGVEGVTETQSGAVAAGGKRKDTGDLCVETKVSLVAKVASKAPMVHLATLLLRLRTQ